MLRSETAANPARRAAALKGLAAYQTAERIPRPAPPPVIADAGRAALRDFGGSGRPVLMVPSLINPPYVLNMAEGNSLAAFLRSRGFHPLAMDWGTPDAGDAGLSIASHVEHLLLPLIDACPAPPVLLGYCLGGTMALAAAAMRPVAGLALLAAPWRFAGFPDASRDIVARLGESAAPVAEELGVLPIEVLQALFWQLDPARTIAKFEAFGALDPASPKARAFVALEDWASDGPPLTRAAGDELIDVFFGSDATGRGEWRVGGRAIDPAALTCPVLDVVSTVDRIVPSATSVGVGERLTLDLGHVGMVVGSRAPDMLWHPLARWLSGVPAIS